MCTNRVFGESVKEIVFIRHAKVAMDSSMPIHANSLKRWEEAYNSAAIVTALPDPEVVEQVMRADYVVCSGLKRSIDSVILLGAKINEKNPLFNEATIPELKGRWIKMKPVYWLLLFRTLSFLRVGRWARKLNETKTDAKNAAKRLQVLATQYDRVVLVGHGVMNWLIRKELKRIGWVKKTKEAHDNWGYTILTLPTA